MLRTVIVDADPAERARLVDMLAEHSDVHIVAEYGGLEEASCGIGAHKPDLLFVTPQLPGCTGWDAVETLCRGEALTILASAHEADAVRAFEIGAVDYLLKPITPDRLELALTRARRASPRSTTVRAVEHALEMRLVARRRSRKIVTRDGESTYLHRPEDVEWVESKGSRIRLHVNGKVYTTRETMNSMGAQLDPSRFLRVSRSAIVNLDHVSEIMTDAKGELVLRMSRGILVPATGGYAERLHARITRETNPHPSASRPVRD